MTDPWGDCLERVDKSEYCGEEAVEMTVNKNLSPTQVNMGVNHVKLEFYERSA